MSGDLRACRGRRHQGREPNPSRVVYVGDTVADIQTVLWGQVLNPGETCVGIGVLLVDVTDRPAYQAKLIRAGATVVFTNVEEFTPAVMAGLG
jgi:HAD superfamily phosphatase